MRIAFLNQKGGAGKTTLATSISDTFARRGKRVLLVDADPQGSSLEWAAARDAANEGTGVEILFPVVGLPTKAISTELPALAKNYDIVVIDGPPRIDEISANIIMVSDLVLIPVQPSPYDVWACDDTISLIERAKAMKPNLEAVFIINQKIKNTIVSRDVHEALSEYPLQVLNSEICQLTEFKKSAGRGQSVIQTEPNGRAAREISKLSNEIMECFDEQGNIVLRKTA